MVSNSSPLEYELPFMGCFQQRESDGNMNMVIFKVKLEKEAQLSFEFLKPLTLEPSIHIARKSRLGIGMQLNRSSTAKVIGSSQHQSPDM